MLSLVEDIEDDAPAAESAVEQSSADVLRFPGGVGPREEAAPTGEQPVLVIDTDEPIATSGFDEPVEPSRPTRRKPRFFGLGRKKQQDTASEGWFTDGPRDFNWD